MIISEADYKETACPCIKPDSSSPIPVYRVIEKLDYYLNKKDFDAAQRHLLYWQREAEHGNDARGKLTVLNELIGLYRKTGNEKALEISDEAVTFAESYGYDDSITMGTTLINAATAYNAFEKPEKGLELYERAQKLYTRLLKAGDSRFGGLYNNMALALMRTGEYDKAEQYFFKAIDVMSGVENGAAQQAVTYCNLADLVQARYGTVEGESRIAGYLEKAFELLSGEELEKDGEYAFVCEKCAPVFSFYGYFLNEAELIKRAEEIYERN